MLYVILNLPKPGGGTKPKWISTGLKDVRGNKKKADEILQQYRREYTEKLEKQGSPETSGDMLVQAFHNGRGGAAQSERF